jgi:hypothetical protein
MALPDLPILLYRGHLECEIGFDHSAAFLSADLGGGASISDVIFPKLRTAALSYPTLHRDAMIEVAEDTFVNRLEYIVEFYNARMEEGNSPFLMKFPYDSKWYLFKFEETNLSVRLLDLYMGASGLRLKQCYEPGIVPDNADGSFDEAE